jgi:hypothetical protein
MNAFEFARKIEKINPELIRKIGIESVNENSEIVIQDAITENLEGKTFAGNSIESIKPFSDWEETGGFHDRLTFAGKDNIEFTSSGDGAEAVFNAFTQKDTIAPTAKILSSEAIKDLKVSFIKKLKAL